MIFLNCIKSEIPLPNFNFLPRATRVHHNNFNRLMDYMKLSSKRGMFYSQLIKKKDFAFILYQTRAYVKEIKSTLLFITILVDIFNKGPWSPPHPRFPLSIVPLVLQINIISLLYKNWKSWRKDYTENREECVKRKIIKTVTLQSLWKEKN